MEAKKLRKKLIKQSLLKEYLKIKEHRLEIDRKSREIKKKETELHDKIFGAIDEGRFVIEKGKFTACIKEGSRRPSWKDEFIAECGKKKADQVIANTPYSFKLVVEEVD
jgi:hypothetical protein